MITEFRAFLIKANAIALAIGVVLGAAVAKLVGAVADDVLMPIIGLVLPGGNWREARIVMSSSTDAAGKVTENAILYGHLIGALLDFVIVAFVVFLVMKWLIKEEVAAT
jgi:large conductance mechanosensitive channel